MGIERTAVSSKLGLRNAEFINEWAATLKPHPVSDSSLVDLCVSIVRVQHAAGKIDLAPEALQDFLENGCNAENGKNGGNGGKK